MLDNVAMSNRNQFEQNTAKEKVHLLRIPKGCGESFIIKCFSLYLTAKKVLNQEPFLRFPLELTQLTQTSMGTLSTRPVPL